MHCPLADVVYPIELRRIGSMEVMDAASLGAEYYAYYVTGSGPVKQDGPRKGDLDEDSPMYCPPVPLPPVDGQAVQISEGTCRLLATIELAQVGPREDRYRFEELVAMSCSNSLAEQLMEASFWVMPEGGQGNLPSSSGTASSSVQPESFTATPNCSNDTTNSSGA